MENALGFNMNLLDTQLGDRVLSAATLAAMGLRDTASSVTATVGATLTAAQVISGLINRTGPTAVFSDTTDTAVAIAATQQDGTSFYLTYKNGTAFAATLLGGTGVTFSSSPIVPANSAATLLAVINAAGTAVVFNHISTVPLTSMGPEAAVALATVGAAVITGAGIASQLTTRGGVQIAAFTDTTDTAVAIIAAQPNVHVGASWEYTYVNNTIFPATLAAGVGVTLSGAVLAPANSWIRYLVTYTAAGAISMTCIAQGMFPSTGTFVANGVTPVTVANANMTAGSNVVITLKTVGGTVGAIPHLATVTPQTGFTVIGTASDTSTYNYEIRG